MRYINAHHYHHQDIIDNKNYKIKKMMKVDVINFPIT